MKTVMIALMALFGGIAMVDANDSDDVTARNIAVVRSQTEKLNRGDIEGALGDFAEDTRNFGKPVDRKGVRLVLEDIWRTFPDWHFEIVDILAAGDSVVVRYKVTATHNGVGTLPINGGMLVGVAPTHKRFEVQHIHWYKLRDGKIVDHYATRDDLGMMKQLGLLPEIAHPDTK
jgi:predicted ester cyclase